MTLPHITDDELLLMLENSDLSCCTDDETEGVGLNLVHQGTSESTVNNVQPLSEDSSSSEPEQELVEVNESPPDQPGPSVSIPSSNPPQRHIKQVPRNRTWKRGKFQGKPCPARLDPTTTQVRINTSIQYI